MDVGPKMYVGVGTPPFVFHVYVIRKYCMISVNYKKVSHLSFCGKKNHLTSNCNKRKCNQNNLLDIKKRIYLIRPAQKDSDQFSQSGVASNFDIASTRIHVEKFIGWDRDGSSFINMVSHMSYSTFSNVTDWSKG